VERTSTDAILPAVNSRAAIRGADVHGRHSLD